MNIYDQIMALPRAHRLCVAKWILRNNHVKGEELRRVTGRTGDRSYAHRTDKHKREITI